MSLETVAVGVLPIIGTLLGVVVGLVVQDRLRRRGEVRREVRAWVGGTGGGETEERHFEVRFFNNRDVNIALWDSKVEFYEGESLIESLTPEVTVSERPFWTAVGPIDLPSRTSVYKVMRVEAGGDLLEKCRGVARLRFVATVVPGGEQLVEPLRRWAPYEQAPS